MLEIKKIAAIDIGSNAIRLLISNVIISEDREPQFKKSSLVRVPIRLGADAFTNNGIISDTNIGRLIDAMEAFKLLMNVHGVAKYKACATSAMREATNRKEVTDEIFITNEYTIFHDISHDSPEDKTTPPATSTKLSGIPPYKLGKK